MGNTCYANATLQLLRCCNDWNVFGATHTFSEEFKEAAKKDKNKRILLAYIDIMGALWTAYRPAYVRPVGFLSEVREAVKETVYESFGLPVPNDSHEYLVYLLDHFHEALNLPIPYVAHEYSTADPIERMRLMAENGWNTYRSKHSSIIVDYFFGMMRKTITCQNCRNQTYQWEVCNVIKVPCKGQTFMDWIRAEVQETTEIEGYVCESCHGRHTANIQSAIWRLPTNLIITLRRFEWDGTKNQIPCPYQGELLSLGPYFADESPYAKDATYELRGITDHHGTHRGGHYTTQFKHPLSHQWWWMDDERNMAMEGPQFTPANYMMLLKRINP